MKTKFVVRVVLGFHPKTTRLQRHNFVNTNMRQINYITASASSSAAAQVDLTKPIFARVLVVFTKVNVYQLYAYIYMTFDSICRKQLPKTTIPSLAS